MMQAFEYLLAGCGVSLLIAALRLTAFLVSLSLPDWLDHAMVAIACVPMVGLLALIGVALVARVV